MLHSKFILLILVTIFTAGCSTIYGRQNDAPNVHFQANVEDVLVDCNGQKIETPGNLALRQSKTFHCVASKEGFVDQKIRVHSVISQKGFDHSTRINWEKWSKWTLGIGHLIAWPIDFVSGSMRSHEKDRYIIDMKVSEETGLAKKALSKTVSATKTLLSLPGEVVDETATTVFDSTLRSGSEGIGITAQDERQAVEDKIAGKDLLERYESESQGS